VFLQSARVDPPAAGVRDLATRAPELSEVAELNKRLK
jgi:hypothetical protein